MPCRSRRKRTLHLPLVEPRQAQEKSIELTDVKGEVVISNATGQDTKHVIIEEKPHPHPASEVVLDDENIGPHPPASTGPHPPAPGEHIALTLSFHTFPPQLKTPHCPSLWPPSMNMFTTCT